MSRHTADAQALGYADAASVILELTSALGFEVDLRQTSRGFQLHAKRGGRQPPHDIIVRFDGIPEARNLHAAAKAMAEAIAEHL